MTREIAATDGFLAPKTTDALFRKLIVLAAGPVAEQKYLKSVGDEDGLWAAEDNFLAPSDLEDGSPGTDWEKMSCIIDELSGYPDDPFGLCNRAFEWAKRMVEKDWHLIEQVAQKLMSDGYCSATDVPSIMKRKRFRSRRVFKMPGTPRVKAKAEYAGEATPCTTTI